MESCKEQVLKLLQDGATVTQAAVIDLFKCYRLSAVIYLLRKEGWDIVTELHKGKRGNYGVYKLRKDCE